MNSLQVTRLVAGKDMRIELRSRVLINQVLPFAAIVMVLFAFALDNDGILERVAPGLIWLATLFSMLVVVQRSFAVEAGDGALTAVGLAEVLDHLVRLVGADEDDAVLDLAQLGLIDAIAVDGSACDGAGGYSDIAPATPVVVTNGKGDVLATTSLGAGKGDAAQCTFSFSFPVTEGQDRYVVSVGRRGAFTYSFGQLSSQGVHIRLGH